MPPSPPEPATPSAELVGATSAPILLGREPVDVEFEIDAPTGPARLRADRSLRKVYLHVTNITSAEAAPNYLVYLNLPSGEPAEQHPELRVGTLAMFGLRESSRRDERHPGNGLSFRFDVTGIVLRLVAEEHWDAKRLRVTFVPGAWESALAVQVGQIRLYFV
jgi:tyrosinase